MNADKFVEIALVILSVGFWVFCENEQKKWWTNEINSQASSLLRLDWHIRVSVNVLIYT
jgi:hypothetical protein